MLSRRVVFIVSALLTTFCRVDADPTIRIRADFWMPYNGAPDAKKPGYVVELARVAFAPQGVAIDYQTMSWDAALKAARTGEIDAVIGANKTEAQDLVAQTPVGAPTLGLFCRKGFSWHYDAISSLRKVRLGIIQGYSYWDALDAYIAAPKSGAIIPFAGETPLADALKKLDSEEIDVIAETIPVFVWNVKTSGRKMADYALAYTHEGEPIYLAFSKTDQGQKYAAIFDDALKKMRKSGELARILASYGLTDWNE